MVVYMVYAYDDYYPEPADRQVQGLYLSRKDATEACRETEEEGRYDHVGYKIVEVQ